MKKAPIAFPLCLDRLIFSGVTGMLMIYPECFDQQFDLLQTNEASAEFALNVWLKGRNDIFRINCCHSLPPLLGRPLEQFQAISALSVQTPTIEL